MTPSLATGKPLVRTRLHQLLIVTDEEARLVAVGVIGKDNQQVNVALAGEPDTMILRARWNRSLPMRGDYVMSPSRARRAYRIVDSRVTGQTGEHERLELRVARVDLPLPRGAVVHPWKWHPRGDNAGVKTPLDSRLIPALCDRQRVLLANLVAFGGWARPRDIGGGDGSHHSAMLASLIGKGMAERKERGGRTRMSYLYRATDLGRSHV